MATDNRIIDRIRKLLALSKSAAKFFTKGTPIGSISSGAGYTAGRKAGATVRLSGGGPALGAGQAKLRG